MLFSPLCFSYKIETYFMIKKLSVSLALASQLDYLPETAMSAESDMGSLPPALAQWLNRTRCALPTYRPSASTGLDTALTVLDAVLGLAYAGPKFKGFQRQVVTKGGSAGGPPKYVRTVEGTLLSALVEVTGDPDVKIQALSRTDTDVSARDQLIRVRLHCTTLRDRALGPAEL